MNELKINAAKAAMDYLGENSIIGVGTGSTANCFINELAKIKHRIEACIPSSTRTEQALRAAGLPLLSLNDVASIPLYVDGADEANEHGLLIKGGGGALTREKIIATTAQQFICIVDESKMVPQLGRFPIAVEVLSFARSMVARELVKLGGNPVYRQGFITDNGHVILDVFDFPFDNPLTLEEAINAIPGVVENGIFAKRQADIVLLATKTGVKALDCATSKTFPASK